MEQKILPVIYSSVTSNCLETIYKYGAETFSPVIAERFILDLIQKCDDLCSTYLQH